MEPDDQRQGAASYERLRHLQAIGEAALAHLRFDDLVAELLTRVTEILSADTAAVLLLDDERDELVARAAKGLEEEVEAGVRIPLGRGFAGRVAADRRPIALYDVEHADIYNPILHQKGVRSMLGVPLLIEGAVIGVLHVGALTPRRFSADDTELLQLAADRIALAVDHSRLYEAERHAAEQLRRLEAVTEAALAHMALDDLLDLLLERVRALIAADTAVVMLLDDEHGELVTRATLGVEPQLRDARIPLGEGFSGRVAAAGRALAIEDLQASDVQTAALRDERLASMIGVPLLVSGRVTGILGLGTFDRRSFAREDVELIQRAGDRIALAIENARLYEAERSARAAAEAAAEQIRRIESISEVALHHIALDDEILERLLTRVRDVLGVDTAALLVADDARQTLVARAAQGLEAEVERDVEVPLGSGFAGRVAARRAPLVIDDASNFEVVSPLLRESGVRSLAGVPLMVEERLLGVLFVGTLERRGFTPDDIALLGLVGERLTVALEHSRMYEREHFVAETLQRSLLPERLPELPRASVASRYLPGEGEAVGGDWYDVIPLSEGRFALAMGDVVSRGLRAASVMGQLRNALRAYALQGHPPAQVLAQLDGMAHTLEGRELATAVYAIYDPSGGTLAYSVAGHPPPLRLAADGTPTLLEEGRGPPLGALIDSTFAEASATLRPGDTLLLYTDGLVERRDRWIDEGLELLVSSAREGFERGPDGLVEHLILGLLGDGATEDDVALLAMRADSVSGALQVTLPADPAVLASMRQSLRDWLADVGADAEETYDILVAASEAAANAVEHAYGPADATFVLEGDADAGDAVTLVVRDGGKWRPPRGQNRGRGTLLMQELMDDFEVTTGDSGTAVRMSKRLATRLAA